MSIKKVTDDKNKFGEKVESKNRRPIVYWVHGVLMGVAMITLLFLLMDAMFFPYSSYIEPRSVPPLTL